jgi:uncharacterized membrane protein (UPF0127 family)
MRTGTLFVGNDYFVVDIPETIEEKQKGLMEIKKFVQPMVFLFEPGLHQFWMHRTCIGLDIVFVCDNVIVEILQGHPQDESMLGSEISDMVIEFPRDFCKNKKIDIGAEVFLIL